MSSLSITGSSNNASDYDLTPKAPPPKPTTSQQMDTLAQSGDSAQQISATLGVPLSQVDTALGIETTATTSATAVVAAAARLSVQA